MTLRRKNRLFSKEKMVIFKKGMAEKLKKVVIIHQGALGDLINTLPGIQALRSACDELIAIGNSYFRLLEHCQLVNRFFHPEAVGFYRLFLKEFQPEDSLQKIFADAELALSWLGRSSENYQKNLSKLANRITIFKGSFPPPPGSEHITKILAQPIIQSGIEITDFIPRMSLPDEKSRDFCAKFGRFFALHPGSGSAKKNLPVDIFAELLSALSELYPDRKLILLLGHAEQVPGFELLKKIPKPVLTQAQIINNLDLISLAYLLKSAELYLGMDSGVTHLASALGAKTLTIFGPTDPKLWAPPQKWARALASDYPCAPCSDEKRRNCQELFCWKQINKDKILKKLKSLLETKEPSS